MSTNVTWADGITYSIPAGGEINWPSLSNFLLAIGNKAAISTIETQSIRVATSSPVTMLAASDCTVVTNLSVAGPVTVNLAAGNDGRMINIVDGKGDASTNLITINRSGSDTINGATSLVLNHNRQSVTLQYSAASTDWKIISSNLVVAGTITPADISGVIPADKGGTGVSNNPGSTVTRSGAFAKTETLTGVTNITYPTTGTLATLAGAETLTNKTLTSPVLQTPVQSGYEDYTDISTPAAPAAGVTRIYTKGGNAYKLTSTLPETLLGGSAGSGELNLITSPSTAAGWAQGTGYTLATTTTAGDLPLAGIIATAIKITSPTTTSAEGTLAATNSFAFTTPASYAVKTKVEFWMRPGTNFVPSEWTVSIYDGSNVRRPLTTDSGAVTYLPNALGKFTTYFDALASTSYTLRFTRTVNAGANAGNLNVVNVIVGPGIQPQGAVVGPWQSYTPTVTGLTSTYTVAYAEYRRVGDTLQGKYRITTTATGTGSGQIYIGIPAGLTINFTYGSTTLVGSGTWYNTTSTNERSTFISTDGVVNGLRMTPNYNVVDGALIGTSLANGDSVWADFSVKINEWSGSATVNLAQNDVQYAYNTDTSTANNTTAFGYGTDGIVFGAFTSSSTSKTVRFQTPSQVGDVVDIQIWDNVAFQWVPVYANRLGSISYVVQNNINYGMWLQPVSATDYIVNFGNYAYASGTTYASAGYAWGNLTAYKWRVRRASSGQAVGFGAVVPPSVGSPGSSGLVPAAGLPGRTDGNPPPTGAVGEFIVSRVTAGTSITAASNVFMNYTSITLTAGEWDVSAVVNMSLAGATTTANTMVISINSGNVSADHVYGDNCFDYVPPTVNYDSGASIPNYRYSVSFGSTLVVYLKGASVYSAGTPKYRCRLSARRVG